MTEPTTDEPMLRFFRYGHLSQPEMRAVSAQFAGLARVVCERLPRSPERTVALRKLLEAKDAAVRCVVDLLTDPGPNRPDESFPTRVEDPGVPPAATVCVCGEPEMAGVHLAEPGGHKFAPATS